MLPGTADGLNAGTQLGCTEAPGGVASPAVLVVLGLLPLLARWALRAFNRGA